MAFPPRATARSVRRATVLAAVGGALALAGQPAAAQVPPVPAAPPLHQPADPAAWRTFAAGDEVLTLQTDPADGGRLWAGTENGGVVVWDVASGGFVQHAAPAQEGLPSNRVYDIAFASADRTPWLATAGGVVRADGPAWRAWGVADGLPSDVVRTVAVDGRGVVWAGADAGIAYLAPGAERWQIVARDAFTRFSRAAKKGPGATGAIDSAVDGRGRVWFAHGRDRVDEDRAALSWFDPADGAWRHVTSVGPGGNPANGPQTEQITALAVDGRDGALWIGTWLRGLYRFDGTDWQWHTPASGLCGRSITALAAVGAAIWAACADEQGAVGTARYDGARWSASPTAPRAPFITGIAAAGGRVWFAASSASAVGGGLATRDGGPGRTLSTAGVTPAVNDITAVAVDGAGRVWAGTRGFGVLGFDGRRWSHHTAASTGGRLAGDAVTDLAIAGDTLWVAATKSLYDGARWTDGGVSALDLRSGRWQAPLRRGADALPDTDVGSLLFGADGRLWIGLGASPDGPGATGTTSRGDGLVVYDPARDTFERHTFALTNRGLVGDTVLDLAQGPTGVWIGASHHLDAETETRIGGGVSLAAGGRFGGWTGGFAGLETYHGTGFGRDPFVTGDVRAVTVAADGTAWAGTYDIDSRKDTIAAVWPFVDAVVNRFDGHRWQATRFPGEGWVGALAIDGQGRLWAGTTRGHAAAEHAVVGFETVDKAAGGLRLFDGRGWLAVHPSPDRLGIKSVTALAWDATRGGIWVGTENAGLHLFLAAPPTPTPSPSPTATLTPTDEPTPSPAPSATPTARPTGPPTAAPGGRLFLPALYFGRGGITATRR